MSTDNILTAVKVLIDELEIKDEDVCQEIYLKALINPKLCKDNNMIISEIINPVMWKNFNDLAARRDRFVPYTSLDKINRRSTTAGIINDIQNDTDKVQKILEASDKYGMLHSYILNEYFMKDSTLNDISNTLNISLDMTKVLVDSVLSDIRKSIAE